MACNHVNILNIDIHTHKHIYTYICMYTLPTGLKQFYLKNKRSKKMLGNKTDRMLTGITTVQIAHLHDSKCSELLKWLKE